MAEKITQRTNAMANKADGKQTKALLDAALADLTALRSAYVALTAKLDADAGVTDTDYNTLDPAALTLES